MVFPGNLVGKVHAALLVRVNESELTQIATFRLETDLTTHVSSGADWGFKLYEFLEWCNREEKLRQLVEAVSRERQNSEKIDEVLQELRDCEQPPIRNISGPKGIDTTSFRSSGTPSSRVSDELAYKGSTGASAMAGEFSAPMDSAAKVLGAANAPRKNGAPTSPSRAKHTLVVMESHVSQLKLVLECLYSMESVKDIFQTCLFGERLKRLRKRVTELPSTPEESKLHSVAQDIQDAVRDLLKSANTNRSAIRRLAEYQPRQKLDPKLEDAVTIVRMFGDKMDGTIKVLDEMAKVCQSASMDCLPGLPDKIDGIETEIDRLLSDLADANTTCFTAFGTCLNLLNGDLQLLKGQAT